MNIFENAKVGDLVVIKRYSHRQITKIEKVNKASIIVSGLAFSRNNGALKGQRMTATFVRPATEADIKQAQFDAAKIKLKAMIDAATIADINKLQAAIKAMQS